MNLTEQIDRMKSLIGINEGKETGVAAGAMIICKDTKKVLVALRSETSESANTWCGLGGGVEESDKSIPEAIKRELEEEIGFTGEIKLVPGYVNKHEKGFTFHNYFGFVDKEFEPKLNDEHTDAKWVSLDELINMEKLHPGLKKFMDEKKLEFEKYLS